jgi:hypothetical protein
MFFACYHACPGVTANKPVSVRGLPASAPPKSDGTVIKRTWPGGFRSARFAEDRLWPNGKPVPQGCGRKPAPLPQRHVDPRPAGGPKPPASARPAHGGRFPPAGSGAGLRYAWTCRSTGNRRTRAGETQCVFCSRPERGNSQNPNRQRRCHGRGHRSCHSATLPLGQPGAQSPRPAPAPPPAGASRPPGRALACRWCGWHGSSWQRSARAGETRGLSGSRPEGQSPSPDREAFPGRRAGVVLFQHPVRGIRCAATQPARPDNRDGSAAPQARS